MDSGTGDIYMLDDEALSEKQDELNKLLIPLTERQKNRLIPQSKRIRKNKMRNQKCVCGSGVKFKKCCWSKYD